MEDWFIVIVWMPLAYEELLVGKYIFPPAYLLNLNLIKRVTHVFPFLTVLAYLNKH